MVRASKTDLIFRAAESAWKGCLQSIHGVDISEPMLQVAQKLLSNFERSFKSIEFRRFLALSAVPRHYDLTVAAFAMSDLPDDGVRNITIDTLWEQTKDIFVLIERGTPEGWRTISNARTRILSNEGYVDAQGETIDRSNRKSDLHIIAPVCETLIQTRL